MIAYKLTTKRHRDGFVVSLGIGSRREHNVCTDSKTSASWWRTYREAGTEVPPGCRTDLCGTSTGWPNEFQAECWRVLIRWIRQKINVLIGSRTVSHAFSRVSEPEAHFSQSIWHRRRNLFLWRFHSRAAFVFSHSCHWLRWISLVSDCGTGGSGGFILGTKKPVTTPATASAHTIAIEVDVICRTLTTMMLTRNQAIASAST